MTQPVFCDTRPLIKAICLLFSMTFLFGNGSVRGASEPPDRFCGIVLDAETKKPMPGANVRLLQSRTGAASDETGRFCLDHPHQSDTLEVTYIGYKPALVPIHTENFSGDLTISLEMTAIPLRGVSVEAFRDQHRDKMALDPSARRINAQEIQHLPVVAVPDVMRLIQTVPGVTFTSEASPQICVRGGNPDQNLILLDDVVIYYPYHFLGITSSLNPDLVEAMDFSTGGFSVRYGDRLSSVLAVQSKKPVSDFTHRLNLSLIGMDGTFGGRRGKRVGWFLSGRIGFMDIAKKILNQVDLPYRYYDLYGKVEIQPFINHLIRIAAFRSSDFQSLTQKFNERLTSSIDADTRAYQTIAENHYGWTNQFFSLQWQTVWGKNRIGSIHVYQSQFANDFQERWDAEFPEPLEDKFSLAREEIVRQNADLNTDYGSSIRNSLTDRSIKISYEQQIRPDWKIECGFQSGAFRTDYSWNGLYDLGESVRLFFDHAGENSFLFKKSFRSIAGYAETEFKVKQKMDVRPGIRLTKWSMYNRSVLEPRLALKYTFSEQITGRLALGRFSQGLSTALEEGLIQFLGLYFPVEKADPETANHLIGSLSYQKNGFEGTITGYVKQFRGLIKSIGPEPTFVQTPGVSTGMEFEVKGRLKGFDWGASYALSRSRRTYNAITYDANFDQRHRVQFFGERMLGKKWTFSWFWEFHTGQPYHPGIYYTLVPASDSGTWFSRREIDVPRGLIRYPPYHRLDIQIMKSVDRKGFTLAPYLSIRNVYNRRNVLIYSDLDTKTELKNGKWRITGLTRKYFSLPIIPTFGIRMGW